MSADADEWAEVPSIGERAWLEGELGALVEACGAAAFVEAPIVEPTPTFFPDPWTADAVGVRRLVERVFLLSGMGDLEVVIDQGCPARDEPIWIESLDAATCRLGLSSLEGEDPAGHAVMLAGAVFRHVNGLVDDASVPHGYRARPEPDPEVVSLEAKRAEVATLYLGFGILAANHCLTIARVRETSTLHGLRNAVYEPALRKTALSQVSFGYGLAMQAAVRGMNFWDRSKLADQLDSRGRGYFKASWKLVADDAAALQLRLGCATAAPGDA